jgi:hypothetical protein
MAYDPTLPTDKDYVRFVLGDTETVELLSDTQILAVLALYPTRNATIAVLAQGLAAQYAQRPDRVTLPSGLSVAWSERVKYWLLLVANGGQAGASGAFSTTPTRADGYATLAAEEAA